MSLIGIVTVLYRSESVLDDYFKSLSEQTFNKFILYVVDNLSPDKSLEKSYELAEKYKESFVTRIIENDDNYGVAKGNNIGIQQAFEDKCDYILLSNNDVELKVDTIEILYKKITSESVDVVIPKIFFYDQPLIWYAGGKFKPLSGTTTHTGYLKPDTGIYDSFKLVDYAPTCFALIHRKVFDKVGLFDERYFVYYDDTDWMYRCNKAGIKMGYVPESVLWHKESTSTGGMTSDFYIKYNYRNQVFFCRKNFSKPHFTIVLIANILHYYMVKHWKYSNNQRNTLLNAYRDGFKMKL